MSESVIYLDAADWVTPIEFYNDLLKQLKAPEGHGRNINALIDSTIYGGMNGVEPPLLIRVANFNSAPMTVKHEVKFVVRLLEDESKTFYERHGHERVIRFEY